MIAATACLPLAACGDGANPVDSIGVLLLAALVLTIVVALSYALGALRGRHRVESELRRARNALGALQQMQDDAQWQTDARDGVVSWQNAAGSAQRSCELFDRPDPALTAALQSRRSFEGLRLQTRTPLDGARTWLLRGVPRQDELGAFDGFVGHARPLHADVAQMVATRALPALLMSHPEAAIVAARADDGHWQALHANAAARALWPQMACPGPLEAVIAELPAPAAAALRAALGDDAEPIALMGWTIQPFKSADGDAAGLVFARLPTSSSTARSDESETFSFTASHDLRAPIRVVEGFTRIVKEDYGHLLDRVGNDHLDRVLGAAARMNLMIDALLTLARLSSQPLARQPVNLSQLAGYVLDELRRASPEREADVDIEPGLSTMGDPTLLRLVLENLLGNAWKYSARAERCQISLGTVPHGASVAYVVRDNGAGFDMRSADRLFGLFQRLHSTSDFPGHGVGLASVRRIVLRHGGDIWAEAEPGLGAAFFFTLPETAR